MAILQEHPAAFLLISLGDNLLGPWSLAAPKRDHVQMKGTASYFLGKPHQLGGGVGT